MRSDQIDEDENKLRVRNSAGTRKTTYNVGEYIFREGEPGDTAFVLLSGKVQITRRIDGKIKPVGIVNVGGMFGEMALIDDAVRMATARAVGGSTEALVVSRRIFEEKLENADPFLRALIAILAKRVRTMVSK
jgi:CRP/FNR family transcriptional regulator, cyclic AMP receptor protein